jgi:lipopolysaccharide/colanic/teichoic acid biosynthesis glycosyltransferase
MSECSARSDLAHRSARKPIEQARWYVVWKQGLDFMGAAILLIPALPLILLAACLVKVTSPGPAFYGQRRLGRGGHLFTIYKIRTMLHDCERLTGPQWSSLSDPRITLVGRLLRRLHIDELPQLWNVLTGNMSLVGPRPERPEIALELERVIPYYHDRLGVRPGMTGLAQVQLPPDTDLDSVRRKLAHDLYYIHNPGLLMDLRILVSTACYLVGMSFRASNAVLALPTTRIIEAAYRELLVPREDSPPDANGLARVGSGHHSELRSPSM